MSGESPAGEAAIAHLRKLAASCFEERPPDMAVFVIALTEDEQRVVISERDSHPEAHDRRKMLMAWLLHCPQRKGWIRPDFMAVK